MPQPKPAEIITSCSSFLYSRPLSPSVVVSNPERWAGPQLRCIHPLSIPNASVEVRSRVNDPPIRSSVTSAPSPGCLRLDTAGNTNSSMTAGSSNASVPGKTRLPTIPCA